MISTVFLFIDLR